jgi:hypothetical protein
MRSQYLSWQLAGTALAVYLTALAFQLGAPVLAEVRREPIQPQHVCPWLQVRHVVKCPLPHTLRPGMKVRCQYEVRSDFCAVR